MIHNYIFDFGNVLARFYPEELTAACVRDKENIKTVSDVVFDRLYWDRLDDGTITDNEVRSAISSRLPENLREIALKTYDSWIDNLTPVKGIKEIIGDIKLGGGKLYLLSNISIGFAENYHKIPWINELFAYFDGLVFSGPLGVVKPERGIFEHLLKTYGLRAEESIFIDDSPKNIAGAEAAGINGCLFCGSSDSLRKALNIQSKTA